MVGMYFQHNRVIRLGDGWEGVQVSLSAAAKSVGDASGDWSPGVVGAVQSFCGKWKGDLSQLAAEAKTTSDGINTAARTYKITEAEVTALMRKIQSSL